MTDNMIKKAPPPEKSPFQLAPVAAPAPQAVKLSNEEIRQLVALENKHGRENIDIQVKRSHENNLLLQTEAADEIKAIKEVQATIPVSYPKPNESLGQLTARFIISVLPVSIFNMCSCASGQTHRPLSDATTRYGSTAESTRPLK